MTPFAQEGLWRVTALLIRQAELDPQTFADRLRDELAPAILAVCAPRHLIVDRRPAQLAPEVAGMFPPLFDGLLGLWFTSADEAAAAMARITADRTVADASAGLIDQARSVVWLAEVFPIKPERGASTVKFLAGGDAAEGWAVADAQAYWRDVHPVIAQTAPTVWGPLTRYVQFHGAPVPAGLGTGPLGTWRRVPMCAEMGFADAADFVTNYSNAEYLAIVRPDEEKFSRPGEMLAFVSAAEDDVASSRQLEPPSAGR